MAALPSNNTACLFIDYRTQIGGVEHTLMLRPASSSGSDITDTANALLSALNALGQGFFRTNWRVITGRARAAGSDVTAPVPLPAGLTAFAGSNNNTYTADREAVEARFVGRSPTTGRRVSFSIYGIGGNIPINPFRITGAASGNGLLVRNAVAALNASGGALRCIDGSVPQWYEYLNLNYNSYWERRIRTGS